MPTASELGSQLTSKRQEHGAFLAQYKTDAGYDMPSDKVGEFQTRVKELETLQVEFEAARDIERSAAENDAKLASQGRLVKDSGDPEVKGPRGIQTKEQLDAVLTKGLSDAKFSGYQENDPPRRFEIPASLKTIVDLTSAYATQPAQVGRAESALFFGDVEPFIPHGTTSSASVVGYIQTTDTDNAAFKAENTAATDSAFVWTATTDEVEIVRTWIPISRSLLEDEPQLQSVITGMLAKRLQKAVNNDLVDGTGTTPQLWGMFTRTGFQTQAKGADPTFDAVHKAITKVRVTGDANPNLAVFHPNDWEAIVLTRTTDGLYILGNPANTEVTRIWGLPVVQTTALTENTGGVVDTSYTMVFENGGTTVEVSTEHSTYFTEGKIALAMFRRLAAFHYRPSAACTITGI